VSHPVYETICNRIARLIERAPVGRPRSSKVSPNAVYLYPSGMSAIYHVHHLLLNWRGAESVVLGFTYELTIKIIEVFGPSYRFYSGGTDTEIDELERHIEGRYRQGSKIQAVWCECPSNPLLRTPNMERLRELADKYEFVVVVDDTIGTFANVDVLSIADIVVTSLTKWFNGFADVLAGW
jgi:cystathionine gamma-synthase